MKEGPFLKSIKFLKRLQDLLDSGEFREVIRLTQENLQGHLNQNERNEILLYRCDAVSIIGDISSYNESLSQVQLDSVDETKFHYFTCTAYHWFMQGKFVKFIKIVKEFEESYQELRQRNKRINQFYFKILSYYCHHLIFFMRNSDVALKTLTKMDELSKKIGGKIYSSRLFLSNAWFYMLNENHEKSLENGQKALKIAEDDGSKYHLINTYYFFGMHAAVTRDVEGEFSYYKKALELAEEIEYQYMVFVLRMHLGNCHQEKGSLKKSLDYFEKTLSIYENIQNDWIYYYIISNVGNIYYIQGDFERALEISKTCLRLY